MKFWRAGSVRRELDEVAVEEPLAIFVRHWRKDLQATESFAVVMRTPGADRELATGLLVTEGVVRTSADIETVATLGAGASNEMLVALGHHVDFEAFRYRRSGMISSACGVCGKAALDTLAAAPGAGPEWRVGPELIQSLPGLLLSHQATFGGTGGAHAAALVSLDGRFEEGFEDVGRHNALDKLIGRMALDNRLPLNRHLLFMSSRASFELIQKASAAGIQLFASVGAPSSLAVETARRLGLTLLCFVRDQRFNVYSGDARLDL